MIAPLHVLAPGEVGGAESVVETLSCAQRRAGSGARVAVLVEPRGGREFVGRMEETAVPLATVRTPHRSYWREWRELTEMLASVEPDLVHTHGYHADVVAGLAARYAGVARICTVHGFTGGGWKNRLYEAVQSRLLRRFDRVIAVSESVAESLRSDGVPATRIQVIRNAWRPSSDLFPRDAARDELGLPSDAFVVGWVGRLSREKGPDVALRAAARIEGDSTLLSIVGAGPEEKELRGLARRLGLRDRVRFHGLVPRASRLFSAFDALLLSSRTEGTPMVLFEAAHADVPVVAPAVGGIPEMVGPEEARLVPPGDPEALARALEEVRRSPEEARRRARRARDRIAREFSVESWVEEYDRAYRFALGPPEEKRP